MPDATASCRDADPVQRIRAALKGSSEAPPRPVCPIELPAGLRYLVKPGLLRALRHAAVLVPLVRVDGEWRVVLTLRAAHLRSHSGQVSFPGGRREEGDRSLADTAIREAEEEIGLDPDGVEVIGYLDDYPTVTRFLVTPVVAVVQRAEPWVPDPGEVAEVFELPLSRVLNADRFRRKVFSREGLKVPFFELRHDGHRIWGATAGMLWNLNRKLHEHGH